MDDLSEREAAARLGRAWDTLLDGTGAVPVAGDPALVDTIRRLRAIDAADAVADPAFLHRLESRLLANGQQPASGVVAPGAVPNGRESRRRYASRPVLAGRRAPSRPRWGWVLVAVFLALILGGGMLAWARRDDGPPSRPWIAAPSVETGAAGTPGAVGCTIPSRPLESFTALLGSPTPSVIQPTPVPPTAGQPADAATIAGITATLQTWVACLNADEPLRFYSLLTDRFFRITVLAQGPKTDAALTALVQHTPTPRPAADQWKLGRLTDVRLLPDGRVVATIELHPGVDDLTAPAQQVILAREGDRWLIDGIATLATDTPTPLSEMPAESTSASTERPWLYVVDHEQDRLVELNSLTLAETSTVAQPFGTPEAASGTGSFLTWLVSADGSTVVEVSRSTGTADVPPSMVYRVIDAQTGEQYSTIAGESLGNALLSRDGGRIVVEDAAGFTHLSAGQDGSSPPPRWFVYDARTGTRIATITSPDPVPRSGPLAALTPDGTRLLYLAVAQTRTTSGPWPVQLVIYDLATGAELGRVDLPGVHAGAWANGEIAVPAGCAPATAVSQGWYGYAPLAVNHLIPGLAVAPNGREAAILHADDNRVTLVDLTRLAVASSFAVDWPAKPSIASPAAGCDRSVNRVRSAAYASDGSALYLTGHDADFTGGLPVGTDLGVGRLDLTTGRLTVRAGSDAAGGPVYRGIVGATDGELYVVLLRETPETDPPGLSTVLQRLDGTTLELRAERELAGGPGVLLSPVRLASPQPPSTPVPEMD